MNEERPTRRRAEVLDTAIRLATDAELAEHGYAGVTFEGVARRARTSKPVLYRRYRSRAHLVIDSWRILTPLALPQRTSGSLRDDLIAILSTILERFERVGMSALRGVLAEADDELLETVTELTWASAEETIERVLRDARERGELGPDSIPQRVLLLPIVLLRHELFFSHSTVPPAVLTEIVDTICLPLLLAAAPPPE